MKRNGAGKIMGVMRGSYAVLEGWVEEEDVGQKPVKILQAPRVRKLVLKDALGVTNEYTVESDSYI